MNSDAPLGNAATVFRRAAAYMGQPWDNVDTETFDMLVSFLGHRIQTLWELAEWPELTRVEKRLVATPWTYGTSYVQGDARFHHGTNLWWQVIDVGGANGTEEPGTSVKWAQLKRDYQADVWDAAEEYAYGDQVLWPFGDLTYAYIGATPAAGILPTDLAYWAYLPSGLGDFPLADVRGVQETMGTVLRVTPDDPYAYDIDGDALEHRVTPDGIRVQGDPGSAWFRYREPAPAISGAVWDSGTTYAEGVQTYFESARIGHFYNALTSSAAAQPDVTPAAWEQVLWPQKFETALALGVYADWLRLDGQEDKATQAEGRLYAEEERLLSILVKQQRQYSRTRVQTR